MSLCPYPIFDNRPQDIVCPPVCVWCWPTWAWNAPMNCDDILQTAIAIAHEAGAVVRDRFPRTRLAHVGFKGAVNPVTETDTARISQPPQKGGVRI